jgi:hypothetical protein
LPAWKAAPRLLLPHREQVSILGLLFLKTYIKSMTLIIV